MGGALGHCQARRYDPAHGAERDGRMPVAAPLGLPTIVMAGGQILTLEFVPWHTLGHKLGESGVTVSLDSRCGNPVEQAFGVRVAGQALGPAISQPSPSRASFSWNRPTAPRVAVTASRHGADARPAGPRAGSARPRFPPGPTLARSPATGTSAPRRRRHRYPRRRRVAGPGRDSASRVVPGLAQPTGLQLW